MDLRIPYMMLLLCICLCTDAQQVTNAHAFRVGDKLERQQAAYRQFDKQEKYARWDLSDIELSDNLSVAEFTENPLDEHGIVANEANTRYYYRQDDLGTFLTGYENNQSKVCYNMPELASLVSMAIGNKTSGYFSGYAIYAESVFSRIYGTYECHVGEVGTLILPTNDSIENVVKVQLTKTTGQHYLSDIENSKALQLLVDSISIYNNDSILHHLATDSCLVVSTTSRWYAKGYRYPIYETIESHVKGNNVGFKAAYYCSPQSQKLSSEDENENEKVRKVGYKASPDTNKDSRTNLSKHIFPDGTFMNYSLETTSDGQVNVALLCTSNARISCGIYTMDGMAIGHKEYDGSNQRSHYFSQSLSSYPHGIYILSISVNGQQFSEKFTY